MNQSTLTTARLDQTVPAITRVGLLGAGLMGSAMARRLLDCGIAVTVWDRDADQVRNLENRGAAPTTGRARCSARPRR